MRDFILRALHRFNWHHMIEPAGMLNAWELQHIPARYRRCSWQRCNFKVWVNGIDLQIVTNEREIGPDAQRYAL